MVQTIFSVHYISMCGLDFGVPWGFDIALTLTSLAVGVALGCLGNLLSCAYYEAALAFGVDEESFWSIFIMMVDRGSLEGTGSCFIFVLINPIFLSDVLQRRWK